MFLFWSKKKKAQKLAMAVVSRKFISRFELTGGLPHGFWDDPYVLGFLREWILLSLKLWIFSSLKLVHNNNLTIEDVGHIVVGTLCSLSGRRKLEVAQLLVKLQLDKNSDYLQGAKNAGKIIATAGGAPVNMAYSNDPDILEVKKIFSSQEWRQQYQYYQELLESLEKRAGRDPSSAIKEEDEDFEISEILTEMLFFDRVCSRLGYEMPGGSLLSAFKSKTA